MKRFSLLHNLLGELNFDISLFKIWQRAWMDRAVLFGFLIQAWQILVGPITVFLIARYITLETQGYYFLFGSILGFQVFFEMGFSSTLLYICAHEWAHLNFDSVGKVVGDAKALSRLASLGQLVFKWYALASSFFVIIVGLSGYFFLNSSGHHTVYWRGPWVFVTLITAMVFWSMPFITMLEGCNQMAITNKFRLFQAILTTLILWLILFLGGGLWAILASTCSKLICNLYLLFIRFGRFFRLFQQPINKESKVSWKNEVWPLQWRTGASAIFSYFGSSLFVPTMFRFFGAAIAGQMGMTLSLIGMLQSFTLVWLSTRAPRFGMLIAKHEFEELDRIFLTTCIISVAIFLIGASILLGVVSLLYITGNLLAIRFLPPAPTFLLFVANMFLIISIIESVYLLAHKRQPISVILPSIIVNLCAGLAVYAFGSRFGPTGAAGIYLFMMIVLVAWETIVWKNCRNRWHNLVLL